MDPGPDHVATNVLDSRDDSLVSWTAEDAVRQQELFPFELTPAGCIMAIAFCGLLMSQITSLNQTGFILVVAVLVGTFVIRTSLVPAVLALANEVNWWPGIDVSPLSLL